MNKEAYPLTEGLTASIAMRLDHSFGIHRFSFETGGNETNGELYERQQKLLKKAKYAYGFILNGSDDPNIGESDNRRIKDEMFGEGFYSPERDGWYCGWLQKEEEAKDA